MALWGRNEGDWGGRVDSRTEALDAAAPHADHERDAVSATRAAEPDSPTDPEARGDDQAGAGDHVRAHVSRKLGRATGPEVVVKEGKVEAGYATDGPFYCGRCRFFIAPGACKKVQGVIRREDCCNYFKHATSLQSLKGHATMKGIYE